MKLFKLFNKTEEKNISLKNVTLVAVSSIKIPETARSLKRSMRGIDFGEVVLISHKKPFFLDKKIKFKKCDQIKNINEYSKFMLYDLTKYINTDYALVVQYDSGILRPEKWDDHFLDYDYIGAPWKKDAHFTKEGVNVRVGNGGFSLRSKKLMNIFNELRLPFTDEGTGYYNEDGAICLYFRKKLEDEGIKFAPVDIASKFSFETECDDTYPEPFGYHKNKK